MTIEDIRGEEIVKIYRQKEVIEQYRDVLISNGIFKSDIYRNIKMYLASEKYLGENDTLSTLFSIDNDLQISINMQAVESRINKKYLIQTTMLCRAVN